MGALFAGLCLAASAAAATFTVEKTVPAAGSLTIGPNATLTVTFTKALSGNWPGAIAVYRNGMPNLYDGVNPQPVTGTWTLTAPDTVKFDSTDPYPRGCLLMIKVAGSLTAADGSTFDPARRSWSYMVSLGPTVYTTTQTQFVVRTVIQNGVQHDLPVRILNPDTPGPHPVMFWVHGGAWTGGTATASEVNDALQAAYLAERLGIACVSVSYRCLGSGGTFTQGLADVNYAVSYIRQHAAAYNIDPNRMGLYGGSAGTPLSSLAAQQQPGIICYVGFNGLYDFINNPGSSFPSDNSYEWQSPSRWGNSPYYHLASPPPNTLLLHGDADTTINHQQSVLFGEKIQSVGGSARVLIYNGQTHGFYNAGREMGVPTLYEMKEHLVSVFGL